MPKNTVAAPAAGAEITLLDLSAQRSGLPRLPDNMKPADLANPYVDYDAKALYAFMASHGVALPAKPEFGYSNLGVGLLGQLLADRVGVTFEALVKEQITAPLGMRDTMVKVTEQTPFVRTSVKRPPVKREPLSFLSLSSLSSCLVLLVLLLGRYNVSPARPVPVRRPHDLAMHRP